MKYITTLVFLFICSFAYSQACGGGELILEFYTKNDEKLKYEISEAEITDEKLLENKNTYRGIKIDSTNLRCINYLKFDKDKLPSFISQSIEVDENNDIVGNQLKFMTLELFNKVFVLRIWSEENEIEILIELFGGCSRKILVIMAEEPIILPTE